MQLQVLVECWVPDNPPGETPGLGQAALVFEVDELSREVSFWLWHCLHGGVR